MQPLPTVTIKSSDADRIAAGHPWVYSDSVREVAPQPADGDLVQVRDSARRLLGVGFFNAKSKIRVRVLAPRRVAVDDGFFEQRIRDALAVRQRHLPRATSFRVVNAESDFLSGLIVDKYEDVLVLQITALGMELRKKAIVTALRKIFAPRAIVERRDVASRKFEGLPESNAETSGPVAILEGELNPTHPTGPDLPTGAPPLPGAFLVTVNLNGLKFEVNLISGHKTGLYLDQQVNYELVARYARGAQMLDCFSFTGGFGLHCARAGANHVHMVDQSAEAVAAAARNAAANGLAEICSAEVANVFDWLKAHTKAGPHEKRLPPFDLIVLDPPSFTRTRSAVPDAVRGYKEIHVRALKLLRPGGVLATFCCSHHVDGRLFEETLLSAAYDTRHVLRRVATFTQAPDHPVIPIIPETEYLKGFAYELVR